MKKALLFVALFVAICGQAAFCQAYDFAYTYQGTTLYYAIDNNMQVTATGPLADIAFTSVLWPEDAKPQGAVVIPDTVEHNGIKYPVVALARKLFYHCHDVTRVTIPQAVTVIPFAAFAYTAIDTMTLHEGITLIDTAAFQTCRRLTSINIPSTVTKLRAYCFSMDTSLTSIVIPLGVDTIEAFSFYDCRHMTSATIPEGVEHIGVQAFDNCISLSDLDLPSTLISIDNYGFSQNKSLTNVVLPEGLISLGYNVFQHCDSMRKIILPSSLKYIKDATFWACVSLDSVIFPDGMRHMSTDILDSCINLTWCHLPDSLEYIDTAIFNVCYSLRNIDMPKHIKSIRLAAFSECSSLEHIEVPEGVTYIEDYVFDHTGLRTIHLPSTLTSIGDFSFYADNQLDTIYMACTTPPSLGNTVFTNFSTVLVVPCGSTEDYRQHTTWGRFSNIITDCDGIDNPESGNQKYHIYARDGRIFVDGADGETIQVFDVTGRIVQTINQSGSNPLPTGVYMVKVGNNPTQKIVVR